MHFIVQGFVLEVITFLLSPGERQCENWLLNLKSMYGHGQNTICGDFFQGYTEFGGARVRIKTKCQNLDRCSLSQLIYILLYLYRYICIHTTYLYTLKCKSYKKDRRRPWLIQSHGCKANQPCWVSCLSTNKMLISTERWILWQK